MIRATGNDRQAGCTASEYTQLVSHRNKDPEERSLSCGSAMEEIMDIRIWTKDEESGDLIPLEFGNVEEISIEKRDSIRMSAKSDTIIIKDE